MVMEDGGLYSPNNAQGMNDAEVRSLWKARTQAFKNRSNRQTREDGLVSESVCMQY
jgi:hypothetical protein